MRYTPISNGLTWSPQLADSLRYTNASLYYAQQIALLRPGTITFSPTSGFHHAQPHQGAGFCTFSGQAIAALKLYDQYNATGAWIDLDGHYGNSIEDTKRYVPRLRRAIPININPTGQSDAYLADLKEQLHKLEAADADWGLDYLCYAHGADSHIDDDQCGQGALTTEQWNKAGALVYDTINSINDRRESHIPLTLSLFGGYRHNDFQAVLDLHTQELRSCLEILT